MQTSTEQIENHYDAIIIGAGIAGLGVAASLTKQGKKILVVERNSFVGGNCSTFLIDKKHRFDFAVHQITGAGPGGLTYDILVQLGLEKKISFLEIDPILHSNFPGKDFVFPLNVDALKTALETEFPKE